MKYTYLKRFVMLSFYVTIGFFMFLYCAMFFFVFVWALLSAILNPSIFLPYTTAALALIATIGAKYVISRKKYENML